MVRGLKADDFYKLASKFYEQANKENELNEAYYRTIIGRAYYAAMLSARKVSNITDSSQGTHKTVINYWKKRKRVIGNRLEELKTYRTDADYNMEKNISQRDAGIALKRAKQILDEFQNQ